jgi:hypothetical protein
VLRGAAVYLPGNTSTRRSLTFTVLCMHACYFSARITRCALRPYAWPTTLLASMVQKVTSPSSQQIKGTMFHCKVRSNTTNNCSSFFLFFKITFGFAVTRVFILLICQSDALGLSQTHTNCFVSYWRLLQIALGGCSTEIKAGTRTTISTFTSATFASLWARATLVLLLYCGWSLSRRLSVTLLWT